MKISVKAKTSAKKESVEKTGENSYLVAVNSPPHEGQANKAIISALANYFDIPKSRISLEHGLKSKIKVFKILLFILLLNLFASTSRAAEIISSDYVNQGKVIKFEIASAESGATIFGEFLGQTFPFYQTGNVYRGIVGVPVDQKVG